MSCELTAAKVPCSWGKEYPSPERGIWMAHNSIRCKRVLKVIFLFQIAAITCPRIANWGHHSSLYDLWDILVPDCCFRRPHMKWVCLACCCEPGNGYPIHGNRSAQCLWGDLYAQAYYKCFPSALCAADQISPCRLPSAHIQVKKSSFSAVKLQW